MNVKGSFTNKDHQPYQVRIVWDAAGPFLSKSLRRYRLVKVACSR